MRYLMILALLLPSACGLMRGAVDAITPAPDSASDSVADLVDDPALTGQDDLPETAPNETTPDEPAPPEGAGTGLGGPAITVAGLGDPSRPGMWLETPLVQAKGQGQVRLVSGGALVSVTLLPAPGEASAGSRLSLAAMRALGAPLTELVELDVVPGG